MDIEEVTEVTGEIVAAMARLVPQLSASNAAPAPEALAAVTTAPGTTLLVARDPAAGGAVVGTLTLVRYRVPTGLRAWIEDVVVDAASRRRGVGEALVRAALHRAEAGGEAAVELTSRPARAAGNRLYRSLVFVRRRPNVFRFDFSSPTASP